MSNVYQVHQGVSDVLKDINYVYKKILSVLDMY